MVKARLKRAFRRRSAPTLQRLLNLLSRGLLAVFAFVFVLTLTSSVFYTRVGAPTRVYAATSSTLNFQGRLLSSNGSTVADTSTGQIRFKIYDGGTAGGPAGTGQANSGTGGTHLWSEVQSNIRIVNGYFSVNLGSQTALPSTIDWSQEMWLTMDVYSGAAYDGEMTNANVRMKLTAVPYAFRAGQADSLTDGSSSLTAANLLQKAPLTIQSVSAGIAGLRFNQTGAGGLIQIQADSADIFTVSKTGNMFLGGTVDIDGASIDIGSSSLAGSLILNDGSANTGTISTAALSANRTYTLPDADGVICLTTTCAGAATSLQQAYGNDADGSNTIIGLTSNDDSLIISNPASGGTDSGFALRVEQLNTVAVAGLEIVQAGTGFAFRVNDDGTATDSTAFVIDQNGNVGIGNTSASEALTVGSSEQFKVTSGGAVTATSLTVTTGGASISGGINNNSGGMTNAGSITGVGTNITAVAGLTVASGGSGDLVLDSASNKLVLSATDDTIQRTAAGLTTIDLADGLATTLTLGNSGLGVADLNIAEGALQMAGTTVITNAGVLQNVTASTSILTSGTLGVARGGTGVDASAASNGQLLIGNGSGFNLATLTQGSGITITNSAGGITISNTLGTSVGSSEIENDSVALGTQTTGNYVSVLGTLTGLSTSGNTGEGSTPTLSVLYGSASNMAVQGNTTLTCASGTGNLSGGGGTITLGVGGSCGSLTISDAPSFATSVTSPIFTGVGAVTLSSGGTSNLTLDSASNKLVIAASDTSIQRTAAGATTIDLIDSSDTTLTVSNGGTGAANLNIAEGALQIAGTSVITNTGVLQNVTADTSILTSGTLSVARGGTGAASFTANGVVYGNGTGALQVTVAGTGGQLLLANASGVPTFTSVSGDASLSDTGVLTISADAIALSSGTVGDYVAAIGSVTGLTLSGNSGEGSTPGLSVNYGSTSTSAVRGDTALICPSGSGNLTGGGNTITLGSGGTCGALSTNAAVSFATSVTTPLLTNSGALNITTTGVGGDITIAPISGLINLNASTLASTGSQTIDLVNAADTLFTLRNSGTGVANLNLADGGLQIAGTSVLTSGRALENLTGLTVVSGGASITGNSSITGTLSVSAGLTVSSGGASITGGLNNNSGGITNAGSITGVGSNITGAGGLTIASGGSGALTLTSASGTILLGSDILQRIGSSLTVDLNNAGLSTFNITNSDASNLANLDVEGGIFAGVGNAFSVNSSGDITSVFTQLNGATTANGSNGLTSSTSLVLTDATDFEIGNYVQVNSANCGGSGVNPCYAKITNKVGNTLTITPALIWATASTVNEYHIPELGGVNTSQALQNRYGRGYFIAGVVTGNGTTYYNEGDISTSLASFDLLNTGVSTLNIGGAATSVNIGAANSSVTIGGTVFDSSLSKLTVGTGSQPGTLALKANAGYNLNLQAGTQSGDLTFTLPSSYGNLGDCLQGNGSGTLTFGVCGNVKQDGNSFGGLFTLGTNDAFGLAFETGGVEQVRIDTAGNVGIGIADPLEKLQVNGGIMLGNTFSTNAGTIRWTGTDFQGYDGTQWLSLTAAGGGGSTTVVEAGSGITKVKASNQVVNNSTVLVNDSDLFFPIDANETRAFRFVIHAVSTAQANLKFAVSAPSGATCAVAVQSVSAGSGNTGCGIAVSATGTGSDAIYEVTGSVVNGATAGTLQLQWAQNTGRAFNTTVYARSFVHSTSTTAAAVLEFEQGGNSFGATAVMGTTDNFGLNFMTNNTTVLSLATSGLATFNGALTTNGALTVNSGGLNIVAGGASIAGGLNLNSGGITNVGSMTGVGPTLTATAGLTIASTGSNDLALNSGSGILTLGATSLQTSDSLTLNLSKAVDSSLVLQNSGAGVASLNLSDGVLQTAGVTRLTNAGALQNITGLTISSGGAMVTGNVTLGGSSTDRITFAGQILGGNPLVFQGAADNSFTTTIAVTDPTANNTITLPNGSGTVVLDTRSIQTAAGSGLTGGGTLGSNLNLSLDINGLGTINTTSNTDFIAVYDSNTSSVKKVSRSDFLQGVIGALTYRGTWNASTNTPILSDATGTNGDIYVVSTGGTQDLGSGSVIFGSGDFVIHNGTRWEKAASSADISSVFGRTGAVTAQSGDYSALQITYTPTGNLASTTVQAALNELDSEKLGSLNGLTSSTQSFANDNNVTITSSGSTHTLGWNGQLSVARGGTGASSFTANGIVYGNGTGALQVTAAGTSGQMLVANATGVPTFVSLSGDATVSNTGTLTIGVNAVALGTDTSGNYMANLGTLTGLTTSGNAGEGSTPTLSVTYGSTSNTAVQGNTTLVCPSTSGNLTGGGNTVTLGTGGTCGGITIISNPTFSTSVTTPALTSTGGLSITSGGSGDITLDAASNILAIASSDTTLQRIASGTYTIDLSDPSATGLTLTNSDAGVANLNIAEGDLQTAGTSRLTNAGALQNITALSLSGAITGATATNTINGLIINSGALSGITTISASGNINTTGVYQQNGTSGMNLTCSNGQYIGTANVRGGIVTSGSCQNDAGLISDARVKENIVQIDVTLDKLKGLNIVSYDYKCEDPDYAYLKLDCSRQTGVIAQELEAIFPELVQAREDGLKEVNLRALGFYNLKAVTEIATKLDSKGDASLNNISTNGELRLTNTGALQNINGLNMTGGSASIVGGLNINGSGITSAGEIRGATNIFANSLTLDAPAEGNILTLRKDGNGVLTIFNNGSLEIRTNSVNSFAIRNADGLMHFNIDTNGNLVSVGSSDGDDKAILFALDTKNTAGDPTGVNGASYYNSALGKFRCYQDNRWQDCLSAANAEYVMAASVNTWQQPQGEHEFSGEPRTWVDLSSAREFRMLMRVSQAAANGATCRIQYAVDENSEWKDLFEGDANLKIDATGSLKTDWKRIRDDARKEVIVRVMCNSVQPNSNPTLGNIRIQLR